MKTAIWFVRSSLSLDLGFLRVSSWTASKKLEFLAKKYIELILLMAKVKPFEFGKNSLNLFGKTVYYDSPYGIAGYQSMLVRHQKMIKFAGLKDIKTMMDIGANVGFYSMMVRELFPNAAIHSVEPVPAIYACLEKNNEITKGKTYNLALSNFTGEVTMAFNDKESAISHVVKDIKNEHGELVKVPCATLDEFCKKNNIGEIDLLKIDTESFEANVLRGAQNTLANTKYLSIEISIEGNSNYTFTELNSLLFSSKHNFQLVSFRNYTDKGDGPITVGDFFFKNVLLK